MKILAGSARLGSAGKFCIVVCRTRSPTGSSRNGYWVKHLMGEESLRERLVVMAEVERDSRCVSWNAPRIRSRLYNGKREPGKGAHTNSNSYTYTSIQSAMNHLHSMIKLLPC